SNSRKQAVVNTTQYTARNFICGKGEKLPVSEPVVAVTMLMIAGMETGSSSNGSISSRFRVRIDMAAKNVPLTTSAQVPSSRATTVENRNATQNRPPTRRRDSSAVGSKAKLKITTTSTAKNSMELKTSRERHSRRTSLLTCAAVSWANEALMRSPAVRSCGSQ